MIAMETELSMPNEAIMVCDSFQCHIQDTDEEKLN